MANRVIGAAVALLLILAACGGGGDDETDSESAAEEAAEELVVSETEAPEEESDSSDDEGSTTDTEAPEEDDDEALAEDDNTEAGSTPPLFGSFGGTLSFTSLLDDTTFDDEFLLSVLPDESAQAVLTDKDRKLIDEVLAAYANALALEPIADSNIVFSQGGADSVGQNTFGAVADRGGGTLRIFTGSAEETYSEFYLIDLTFGEGFPADSQDVMLDVITVGGAPDADLGQALADMRPFLDGERLGLDDGLWNWGFEGSGTLSLETGTPEG